MSAKHLFYTINMRFTFFIFLLLTWLRVLSTPIAFFEGNFEAAKSEAIKQNKLIFIAFYDKNCGHCAQMLNKVYTNDTVGEYFNEHFISIKIEFMTEQPAVVQQFGIGSGPEQVYADAAGKKLLQDHGEQTPAELLEHARWVATFTRNLHGLKMRPNDTALLRVTLPVLRNADPERAHRLTLDFAAKLPVSAYTKAIYWPILSAGLYYPENAVYRAWRANAGKLIPQFDGFVNIYAELTNRFMERAIREKNHQWVDSLVFSFSELLTQTGKPVSPAYALESDVQYYQGIGDLQALFPVLVRYVDEFNGNNWRILVRKALDISQLYSDATALAKAASWAETARGLQPTSYIPVYASAVVALRQGKFAESRTLAQKALLLCGDAGEKARLEAFIREIPQ